MHLELLCADFCCVTAFPLVAWFQADVGALNMDLSRDDEKNLCIAGNLI